MWHIFTTIMYINICTCPFQHALISSWTLNFVSKHAQMHLHEMEHGGQWPVHELWTRLWARMLKHEISDWPKRSPWVQDLLFCLYRSCSFLSSCSVLISSWLMQWLEPVVYCNWTGMCESIHTCFHERGCDFQSTCSCYTIGVCSVRATVPKLPKAGNCYKYLSTFVWDLTAVLLPHTPEGNTNLAEMEGRLHWHISV